MGCACASKAIRPREISRIQDIKINPGQFVKVKQQKFGTVYEIDKEIGKCTNGAIYKCIHMRSGMVRAVKIVKKSLIDPMKEILLLKELDHPNIVKLLEVYEDQKSYQVVVQTMGGGDLKKKMTRKRLMTQREAAQITYQVVLAISYCHKNQILYNNWKLDFLFVDDFQEEMIVKLIDFSNSRYQNYQQPSQKGYVDIHFAAPEIFLQDYCEKSDLWSVGVLMYFMLFGKYPFEGDQDQDIMQKIKQKDPDLSNRQISDSAKELLTKILDKNTNIRVSSLQIIQHP